MAIYRCSVCDTVFDEEKEGQKWDELSAGWACHVCESSKSLFQCIDETATEAGVFGGLPKEGTGFAGELRRVSETEIHMADIHQMAETGESIIEPMRTKTPSFSWDEILIKGAQLARIPLNRDESVNSETVIGPGAKQPLVIGTPVYVTHMSFGALSREAKIALAKGSSAAKTAMCSGEGGILPESLENAYRYIFEYVRNQYSITTAPGCIMRSYFNPFSFL